MRLIALAALLLAGCAAVPPPAPAVVQAAPEPQPAPPPPPPAAVRIPSGDQWLYGSAEASAAALQAYRLLTDFALAQARHRPASSVVLAPNSSPLGSAPLSFVPCGSKPLAVIFDADETLIWNIAPVRYNLINKSGNFDPRTWDAWERTGAGHAKPIPGALEALAALRAANITPVVNTNRSAANAAGTLATLKAAGIGDFVHGRTLFLSGDDATGSSKDQRRATIAAAYCVIAMAGDQFGDFSNWFNTKGLPAEDRRRAALNGPAVPMWGNGWFLLPNPSYGPWASQDLDQVYGPEEWVPGTGAQ